MNSLYDVQQLLKRFGIFVYVGKRIWDIEVMMDELYRLHKNSLIEQEEYLSALMVLKREHRIEEERAND